MDFNDDIEKYLKTLPSKMNELSEGQDMIGSLLKHIDTNLTPKEIDELIPDLRNMGHLSDITDMMEKVKQAMTRRR